jgi:hypothetical protein
MFRRLLIAFLLLPAAVFGQQWKLIAPMHKPRVAAATLFLHDGRLLAGGGYNERGAEITSETYDTFTDTWTYTGSVNVGRISTPFTMLHDGRIFISGGYDKQTFTTLTSTEIFDPITNLWTLSTPLNQAREAHAEVTLNDGKVLISIGVIAGTTNYPTSCELFDPANGSMSFTGPEIQGRFSSVFFDSTSGNALLLAGHYNGVGGVWVTSTEEYDVASGTWSIVANSQISHSIFLTLPNGDILAPSGSCGPIISPLVGVQVTPLIEIYNPKLKTWKNFGNLPFPRDGHGIAYIGNDSVITGGGLDTKIGKSMDDCQIINIKTGAITPGPKLNQTRVSPFVSQIVKDPTNPCITIYRVYAIGGFGGFAGIADVLDSALATCEVIEYRRGTPTILSLSKPLNLSGTVCKGIDTSVTISISTCNSIRIDSMFIENISPYSSSQSFPQTLYDKDKAIFGLSFHSLTPGTQQGRVRFYYNLGGIELDTTIAINLNFLPSPSILNLPKPLSYKGSVCYGIDTSLIISASSCNGFPIDSVTLEGFLNSTVTTNFPDTILNGTQKNIRLLFHSLAAGKSSGKIHIYYKKNGIEIDTIIPISLTLQAAPALLAIPPPQIFSSSICNGIDTTITFSAITCDHLFVDSVRLEGFTNASIISKLPDTLAGGEQKNILISCHSTLPGTTQGFVRVFYSNGSSELDTLIAITLTLNPSNPVLSFPQTLQFMNSVCTGIDTSVTFSLQSCSDVHIDSVVVENIPNTSVVTTTPDTLKNAGSKTIQLSFHSSTPDTLQGRFKVYYGIGSFQYDTTISIQVGLQVFPASFVLPQPLALNGSVCFGIDTNITLSAIACGDFSIDSVLLQGFQNALILTSFPDTIRKGQQTVFPLSFHSATADTVLGQIRIFGHANGSKIDTILPITLGLNASTRSPVAMILNNITNGGDTVFMPIYLASNADDKTLGFNLTAHFNTDLLTPIDPELRGTLIQNSSTWSQSQIMGGLHFSSGQPFSISSSMPLVILKFTTAVTKKECTPFVIDNFQIIFDNTGTPNPCPLSVTGDSATICRANACGDITLRGFLNNGSVPGFSASYDIQTDRIILNEKSKDYQTIEIMNMLGQVIERVNIPVGINYINASTLPAGIYIVKSSDGIQTFSQKIFVLK